MIILDNYYYLLVLVWLDYLDSIEDDNGLESPAGFPD